MAVAIEQLQDTHRALIEAVQSGDWQQVGDLDRLCRELVSQAMAEPERNDQDLADALDSLLSTYREVTALVQAIQGKLAEELQDLQRSKQSARVYQMFS
ncbi:MAG: flagellar protein FliT [Gammaproteobacteria bacterium HGW-Gammaproteobacteria-11]|nr:MAG: flagellar protein FliT [Gammaproteobacteria bacterium HGW-Gammaproteobacteria-11]